mmetsp:Transcript_3861/g.5700  ORF Transcript_3861/g.5700 Transcript_3861/m.5700 type:complete len:217 (-) Transcript_3861:563-1213(-)
MSSSSSSLSLDFFALARSSFSRSLSLFFRSAQEPVPGASPSLFIGCSPSFPSISLVLSRMPPKWSAHLTRLLFVFFALEAFSSDLASETIGGTARTTFAPRFATFLASPGKVETFLSKLENVFLGTEDSSIFDLFAIPCVDSPGKRFLAPKDVGSFRVLTDEFQLLFTSWILARIEAWLGVPAQILCFSMDPTFLPMPESLTIALVTGSLLILESR